MRKFGICLEDLVETLPDHLCGSSFGSLIVGSCRHLRTLLRPSRQDAANASCGECFWFETQRRPPAGSGTAMSYFEAVENALPEDVRGEDDPTKPLCGKIFVHMTPDSKLEYWVNKHIRVQTVSGNEYVLITITPLAAHGPAGPSPPPFRAGSRPAPGQVKAKVAEHIGVPLCMLKLVTGRQDLDRFEYLWDSEMFVFHENHCHIMIGPWAPGATLKL